MGDETRQQRDWRPSRDVLYEGVPIHLDPSIQQFLSVVVRDESPEIVRSIGVSLDIDLTRDPVRRLLGLRYYDGEEKLLDVIAFVLERYAGSYFDDVDDLPEIDNLVDALRDGGSAWMPVPLPDDGIDIRWTLVRRVDETLAAQFDEIARIESSAAEHLRRAWAAAYGRDPNGTTAYSEAVLAVEAALQPLRDEHELHTLGRTIREMRNNKERFEFELDEPPLKHPEDFHQIDVVIALCSALWNSQERHGEEERVVEHSLPQGQAAVHLAIPIVALVQSGAFRRADPT